MRAAVISQGSVSSQMVGEALKKYFDEVDMLQLKNIEDNLGKEASITHENEILGEYDCIYLKGSFRYANLLRSIATMLEGKVPYMPVSANSFTTVHNKLLTHLTLQQKNIPMPRTYISSTSDAAKDLLRKVNYPIVMKFPHGTQGKGVMFADSIASASSLLDALGALNQPFIIQEYVETGGSDVRALVVGEKVIAAMRRSSDSEDKRANLHAGGKGESIQLSREAMNIALDTAKCLGAEICGVDILEGPTGPVVIEANISPGLQGLNEVSTIDIADEIAKFLYRKTEKITTATKKDAAAAIMKEVLPEENGQEIITALSFRGERILLPEFVNKMAQFSERKEYSIKARKGAIEIKEFVL